MPLDYHQYALAYQSALASVRQGGTFTDIGAVAKELASKFPSTAGDGYLYYLNIVQAADRNWRQASVYESDPTATPTGRAVPIDPTIGPSQEAYAWRVVVVAHRSDGTTTETLTVVRSDGPLSGDEIETLATNAVREGIQESSTNPRGIRGPGVTHYTATIVSAGRRR